jgi:hypothetical protein
MEQRRDTDTPESKDHPPSGPGVAATNGRCGAVNREKASGTRRWSARQSLRFPKGRPHIVLASEAGTPTNTGPPTGEEIKP